MTALHRSLVVASIALGSALVVTACQRSGGEPAPAPTAPRSTQTPSSNGPEPRLPPDHPPMGSSGPGTPTGMPPGHPSMPAGGAGPMAMPPAAGGLVWTDPPGWERQTPASPMRRAQYRVPRATGDDADAELTVFMFGAGQGGATEANIDRWYSQVQQPDGRSSREVGQRTTFSVGPLNVIVIDVPGRIAGGGMPGMPGAPTFEHGRLLAAVVETPAGPWFFKMTGHDHTVAGARPAFETMLRSMHTEGAPENTATPRDH